MVCEIFWNIVLLSKHYAISKCFYIAGKIAKIVYYDKARVTSGTGNDYAWATLVTNNIDVYQV